MDNQQWLADHLLEKIKEMLRIFTIYYHSRQERIQRVRHTGDDTCRICQQSKTTIVSKPIKKAPPKDD